jgi:predicted transcriptional regulator of viral defense system
MNGMNRSEEILQILREQSVLRPRDLRAYGISRTYLGKMQRSGLVVREGRGLYSLADSDLITENHTLVEASKRIPEGVVCLYSALLFHNTGTQLPASVWLAVERKARLPRVAWPPVRFVRFSGQAMAAGIETHQIEGVPVRVYSVAKTVADCFKYRHKYGLDVAIEALRDCLRQRQTTIDEIRHFAHVCRVANVMRPYLEAMIG